MTEAASAARRGISERALASIPFEVVVESAPDAIVIIDTDGRITLVNAQTEALFGYSRRELLGRPVEQLLPDRFRAAHIAHPGGLPLRSPPPPHGRRPRAVRAAP